MIPVPVCPLFGPAPLCSSEMDRLTGARLRDPFVATPPKSNICHTKIHAAFSLSSSHLQAWKPGVVEPLPYGPMGSQTPLSVRLGKKSRDQTLRQQTRLSMLVASARNLLPPLLVPCQQPSQSVLDKKTAPAAFLKQTRLKYMSRYEATSGKGLRPKAGCNPESRRAAGVLCSARDDLA